MLIFFLSVPILPIHITMKTALTEKIRTFLLADRVDMSLIHFLKITYAHGTIFFNQQCIERPCFSFSFLYELLFTLVSNEMAETFKDTSER